MHQWVSKPYDTCVSAHSHGPFLQSSETVGGVHSFYLGTRMQGCCIICIQPFSKTLSLLVFVSLVIDRGVRSRYQRCSSERLGSGTIPLTPVSRLVRPGEGLMLGDWGWVSIPSYRGRNLLIVVTSEKEEKGERIGSLDGRDKISVRQRPPAIPLPSTRSDGSISNRFVDAWSRNSRSRFCSRAAEGVGLLVSIMRGARVRKDMEWWSRLASPWLKQAVIPSKMSGRFTCSPPLLPTKQNPNNCTNGCHVAQASGESTRGFPTKFPSSSRRSVAAYIHVVDLA